jgi:hypothetical protein
MAVQYGVAALNTAIFGFLESCYYDGARTLT